MCNPPDEALLDLRAHLWASGQPLKRRRTAQSDNRLY